MSDTIQDFDDPDLEASPYEATAIKHRAGEYDLAVMGHRVRNLAENVSDVARLTARGAVLDLLPPAPVPGWRCGKPHCSKCVAPNQRRTSV